MSLGIDLGTSRMRAAVVGSDGAASLIPDLLSPEQFDTATRVALARGRCVVGLAASDWATVDQGVLLAHGLKAALANEQAVFNEPTGTPWETVPLVALLLRKLTQDLAAFRAVPAGACVIAIPPDFSPLARRQLLFAAQLAGLTDVTLADEPVAAAVFLAGAASSAGQRMLLLDAGAGCLRASLVEAAPPDALPVLLASRAAPEAGGDAVDRLLAQVMQELAGFEAGAGGPDHQAWCEAASVVKHRLGDGESAWRHTALIGPRVHEFAWSSAQLGKLLSWVPATAIICAEDCLAHAGLSWQAVDRVVVLGGASRLPGLVEAIAKSSGRSAAEMVPRRAEQAVAYGAAMIAARRVGDASAMGGGRRSRADLGLRVRDPVSGTPRFEVLVPRGTPIPCQRASTFYTTRADQRRLVFEIVERDPDAAAMESLGYFSFGPLQKPRKNYPVELLAGYDAHGVVRTTARDVLTGEMLTLELVPADDPLLAKLDRWRGQLALVSL